MSERIFRPCPTCGAIGVVNERCEFCGNTIPREDSDSLDYNERVVPHSTIPVNKFAEKIAKFDKVREFKYNCAIVNIGALYGLINLNGDLVIPLEYSKINLSNGYACLHKDESIELLNLNEWARYDIPYKGNLEYSMHLCSNIILLIDNSNDNGLLSIIGNSNDDGLLFDCETQKIITKHIKEIKPTKSGYHYRTVNPKRVYYHDINNHSQYSWDNTINTNLRTKEKSTKVQEIELAYVGESLILSINTFLDIPIISDVKVKHEVIIEEDRDVKGQIDSYINLAQDTGFSPKRFDKKAAEIRSGSTSQSAKSSSLKINGMAKILLFILLFYVIQFVIKIVLHLIMYICS